MNGGSSATLSRALFGGGFNFRIVILGFLLIANDAVASNRIAMVVGNSAYSGNLALANPVNDANALAGVFESMGFGEVISVNDATRLEFETALDNFHRLADEADVAVFYYAGHAIQWQGENFMIPTDVSLESERDIKRLIPLNAVVEDVSAARELGLVILDACRDNPFASQLAGQGTRGIQRTGLASPAGASGTLVAFATQADAVAFDGSGAHSPYTAALIKHLPTPNKDISLVFRSVRDEVAAATDWKQQPFTYGSLGGEEIWLVRDESVVSSGGNIRIPEGRKKPPPGMTFFTVVPVPADARIRILKPESAYAPGMLLPIGQQYEIMISRRGYKATRKNIDIESAETVINVSLDRMNKDFNSESDAESTAEIYNTKVAIALHQSNNGGALIQDQLLASQIAEKLRAKGINVQLNSSLESNMLLNIILKYSITHDYKYNAYNADCSYQFELINAVNKIVVSNDRQSLQPAGGFTSNEVQADCRRRLMNRMTNPLVKAIQASSTAKKGNGLELSIRVNDIYGSDVTALISAIESIPMVAAAKADGFDNSALTVRVAYEGEVFAFVESLISVAKVNGLALELDEVDENNLVMAMIR